MLIRAAKVPRVRPCTPRCTPGSLCLLRETGGDRRSIRSPLTVKLMGEDLAPRRPTSRRRSALVALDAEAILQGFEGAKLANRPLTLPIDEGTVARTLGSRGKVALHDDGCSTNVRG